MRVHWTDLQGQEYPRGKSTRRRRSLVKNWWNYEWLSRILAFGAWMTNGQSNWEILTTENDKLVISGTPLSLTSFFGIDETALTPPVDDDQEVLDDPVESATDSDEEFETGNEDRE